MGRFVRLGLVFAALAALAACSSLGVGTGGGTAPAKTLDMLGDDVASAIVVLDIPTSLEPVPDASIVAFKLTGQGGQSRRVDARLVPADAGEMAANLLPPSADRTYYLFGFSPKDQQQLRDAQAWAKSQPAGALDVQIDLLPELCTTEAINPAATRFSVLAIVGRTTLPLTSNASVADIVKARNRPLPPCAGHSG